MEFISIDSEGITTVFDLPIPQPNRKQRPSPSQENREVRATRDLFALLETRSELKGVYAPADQLAETLRWSA